jgi:prepilin-type N-terminal cleavage/methylation domain-containing protein
VPSSRCDSRRRAGFSLVEVVIALVITGGLVAAIFTLLNGQSRMLAVQSSRHEARQNVRGALEVLSSELRGAVPEAILAAGTQSLTFMQPRAWGVVCAVSGSTVTAVFPATGAVDAFTVAEASGVLIRRDPFTAGARWSPDPRQAAARASITAAAPVSAAAGPCQGMGADGNATAMRITTRGALAGAAGDLAVSYTLTRYDVAQVDGQWWLRRSNGVSNGVYSQQPLAGPLEPGRFRFTYFAGSPAAEVPPPTTSAELAAVRMIRVQVVTISSQSLDGRAQRDSGAVTILLRN